MTGVEAIRGDTETCVPHVVVRVLEQDAKTVRIAAYAGTTGNRIVLN